MRPQSSISTIAVRTLILALVALLAACNGGAGNDAATTGVNALSGQTAQQASGWTTLGSRTRLSKPAQTITTNAGAQWTDYDPPALCNGTASKAMQYITMPDGIHLAAYVTLPVDCTGKLAGGSYPTVLIQTSYNGGLSSLGSQAVPLLSALGGADPYIVRHGYATVVVDVRGTGQSMGLWQAFGPLEQSDYGHVVQWVTQQPWSNDRIGVYGVSYLGITAVITAAQNHPAVKAAFPIVPIGDGYRDIVFTGGQFNPTFIPFWLSLVSVLSVTNPAVLTDPQTGIPVVLTHILNLAKFQVPTILNGVLGKPDIAADGDFWAVRSPLEHDDEITIPTFVVGGLHDLFQRSEPLTYAAIKNNAPAKLLIGPWTHIEAATGKGLPADGVPPLNHIELQWFDQYVRGLDVGADALPNVTQYVIGHGHYVTATDWPHPQAQAVQYYLHGDKSLSTSPPKKGEASHMTLQQPVNGLCSPSLDQWTAGLLGLLNLNLPCTTDPSLAEALDVIYTTPPMPHDVYINGPIQADIWISTTAADAGVSVRVDDVSGSTVTPLTNGLQTVSLRAVDKTRSRYLDGQMIQPWHPYTKASEQKLKSGQIVKVPVEIFSTSALIKKGHRLRIAIGPSNVAQGLPPLPDLLNSLAGVITIHSDALHPSSVVLPVVPVSALHAGGAQTP